MNIVLLELVNLDIVLGSIMFHIMSFKTLCLIYLADMDKIRVFFNNIINEVI